MVQNTQSPPFSIDACGSICYPYHVCDALNFWAVKLENTEATREQEFSTETLLSLSILTSTVSNSGPVLLTSQLFFS
jgi:hypothetical protein